ncbi:MAG: hypothetical protein DRJ67_03400 [Thermoprotei archaeon]|nr:MAG: hypothetical protein DRJ67_03400 [Thermoprotei archaeon]
MMKAFDERALFPAVLAICLLGGILSSALSKLPKVEVRVIKVVGGAGDFKAFIAPEELGRSSVVDFSSLRGRESFLFEEGEKVVLWLGPYQLLGVRVYGEDRGEIVVLELRGGGSGLALLLEGLRAGAEVYAFIVDEGGLEIRPLLRVVEKGKLLEFAGRANATDKVQAYAYASPEDFNFSVKPSPKLFVAESEVVDGTYRIRIELGGGPFTKRGKPLLDVNNTLILYTACTYRAIDLSNLTSTRVRVDLLCQPSPP